MKIAWDSKLNRTTLARSDWKMHSWPMLLDLPNGRVRQDVALPISEDFVHVSILSRLAPIVVSGHRLGIEGINRYGKRICFESGSYQISA